MFHGNLSEAKDAWIHTLQLAKNLQDIPAQMQALRGLGVLYVNVNQSDDACAAYEEGITLARTVGDSVEHCTLLHNRGFALLRRGCPEVAAESFLERRGL